ncbi:hypothetical protein BpHYR1_037482 [Brachionus plicatilis]|uniref:Uncharacterized protein n=1 Tax=Brachionus plicatilis TaxID=10195 RepID=A0A3M7Q5E2_BRAPC|nr:hypothetical protein BpHYR1_037482 [Brachionus plicatilis]
MTLYKCAPLLLLIGIKFEFLLLGNLMQKRSIDHTKWVCGECNRKLSKTCNDKQINEPFGKLTRLDLIRKLQSSYFQFSIFLNNKTRVKHSKPIWYHYLTQ